MENTISKTILGLTLQNHYVNISSESVDDWKADLAISEFEYHIECVGFEKLIAEYKFEAQGYRFVVIGNHKIKSRVALENSCNQFYIFVNEEVKYSITEIK